MGLRFPIVFFNFPKQKKVNYKFAKEIVSEMSFDRFVMPSTYLSFNTNKKYLDNLKNPLIYSCLNVSIIRSITDIWITV